MPSPFPGMNPYLEHPSLWSGIHHRLITAIANDLAPKIRPKYIVAIEERVAFIPAPLPPDPPIKIDDPELIRLLSDADRAFGRLDGSTL